VTRIHLEAVKNEQCEGYSIYKATDNATKFYLTKNILAEQAKAFAHLRHTRWHMGVEFSTNRCWKS